MSNSNEPIITIRELQEMDLEKGFLKSLDSLRKASNLELQRAKNILYQIKADPNHFIFVAEDTDKNIVVGSATLIVEQKFIHDGGKVGHIEDVVVRKDYQGYGVGAKIVRALLRQAEKSNCYKTILDCTNDLIPFYNKLGFVYHSNCMRFDHQNQIT